jgi:hypothetical protein
MRVLEKYSVDLSGPTSIGIPFGNTPGLKNPYTWTTEVKEDI